MQLLYCWCSWCRQVQHGHGESKFTARSSVTGGGSCSDYFQHHLPTRAPLSGADSGHVIGTTSCRKPVTARRSLRAEKILIIAATVRSTEARDHLAVAGKAPVTLSRNETEPAGINNFQNSNHIWVGMSFFMNAVPILRIHCEFASNDSCTLQVYWLSDAAQM